jgi:hypothetical protein
LVATLVISSLITGDANVVAFGFQMKKAKRNIVEDAAT